MKLFIGLVWFISLLRLQSMTVEIYVSVDRLRGFSWHNWEHYGFCVEQFLSRFRGRAYE